MRTRLRPTTALALGSALSGVLAYVLFVAVTRGLGVQAAAPVSVLWTYWAFAGAAFTFPVQHWTTRTVATNGEGAVRRTLPRLSAFVTAAALVLGGLAWLARDDLFHRSDAWFPLMVALVTVGSAVIGLTRGALSAGSRFTAVALSLVAENGLRCLVVVVLLVSDVRNPVAHGLALVAGQLVVGLWPSALRFGRGLTGPRPGETGPIGALTGSAAAQLISHSVLTGGPVVLALSGGSPRQVTALFAALALFRAPYMLALGAVSQVTLRVTQHRLDEDPAPVRRLIGLVLAATAVGTALAALLAAWVGPDLLRLVFGSDVDVPSRNAALLAAGCTVAVASLVLMVVALAHDRAGAVALVWVLAVGAGGVVFGALASHERALTTAVCFLVAESVALVGLTILTLRSIRTPGERGVPTTATPTVGA